MEFSTNIFIGRSGCGKGTQVQKLIEFFNQNKLGEVFHLETGQIFREFIKQDSYSSKLAQKVGDAGLLQPQFLSIWAWANELVKNFKENQHMFLDGTPRRMIEAQILESVFDFYDRNKVNIIYLNVSREWAFDKMLKRGRGDDLEIEKINARLDWFEKDVAPVLDFYRSHKSHNFIDINGDQTIEQVHHDIVESLGL